MFQLKTEFVYVPGLVGSLVCCTALLLVTCTAFLYYQQLGMGKETLFKDNFAKINAFSGKFAKRKKALSRNHIVKSFLLTQLAGGGG